LAANFVASEALTNVTKHARATHARLALFADGNRLVLRVSDDGAGGAQPAGAGLSGLRERVEAAHGDLDVQSAPGTGTVVEARFPLG
jgi:signal transduction histidine kinase